MSARLTRRGFTLGAIGTIHGAPVSRIADTHVHFYDPRRPQGVPWPPKTDALLYKPVLPDGYAALVRPLGVTDTIVVEASARLEDNEWLLDLAKEHRIIAGVIGNLQPDGFARNLERFSVNPLFRGIRLGGGALVRELEVDNLRLLEQADLTLDAIGNAAMAQTLVKITDRRPRLRIAINHMPVEPVGWAEDRAARAAIRELGQRPQVFAKVSGVLRRSEGRVRHDFVAYKESLDEVWETFGPDRVIYGSNWPVSDKLASYDTVLAVVQKYVEARGAGQAEQYLWKNSKACYRWPDRT